MEGNLPSRYSNTTTISNHLSHMHNHYAYSRRPLEHYTLSSAINLASETHKAEWSLIYPLYYCYWVFPHSLVALQRYFSQIAYSHWHSDATTRHVLVPNLERRQIPPTGAWCWQVAVYPRMSGVVSTISHCGYDVVEPARLRRDLTTSHLASSFSSSPRHRDQLK